jgi:hypothetical protein
MTLMMGRRGWPDSTLVVAVDPGFGEDSPINDLLTAALAAAERGWLVSMLGRPSAGRQLCRALGDDGGLPMSWILLRD